MRNAPGWRKFWILLLVPTSVMVLTAFFCNPTNSEPTEDAPTVAVVVRLQNLDHVVLGENIHILAPGEDFSAGNRLVPGAIRELTLTMRFDQAIEFRAGRNGSLLPGTAKLCTCSSACPLSPGGSIGEPRVEWNGSVLSCVGW